MTVKARCFTLSVILCYFTMPLILGTILQKQLRRCTRMLVVTAMHTRLLPHHLLTQPVLLITMTKAQNVIKRILSLLSRSSNALLGPSSSKMLSRLSKPNALRTLALPELFPPSSALPREGERNASLTMSVVGVPTLLAKQSAQKPPLPPCLDGQGFSVPAPLLQRQLLRMLTWC